MRSNGEAIDAAGSGSCMVCHCNTLTPVVSVPRAQVMLAELGKMRCASGSPVVEAKSRQ